MSTIYWLSSSPVDNTQSGMVEIHGVRGEGPPFVADIRMRGGTTFCYVTESAGCKDPEEALEQVKENFCLQHMLYLVGEVVGSMIE